MDRQYKTTDTVKVYAPTDRPCKEQEPVATFQQKPYSIAGCDYYSYNGNLHHAYVNRETQDILIFTDIHL